MDAGENMFGWNTKKTDEQAESLIKQFGAYDHKLELASYRYPQLDLLESRDAHRIKIGPDELDDNKNRIIATLNSYGVHIDEISATIGPSITLYEIKPAPGVRISKIKNLENDIALSLSAFGTHVSGPIPGKGTIGIEVPNQKPDIVSIRSLLATAKFQNTTMDLPVAMGKTMSNEVFIADLAAMPHLLIAGATGQGKSVSINSMLVSLLYKKHPAELKFVLIDISGLELTLFRKIERHFLAKLPGETNAVVTNVRQAGDTLNALCMEIDQRYDLFRNAQARNLKEYNQKLINREISELENHRYLPLIVVVIDEFADLMTPDKAMELSIARLAQLGRPAGIHLIISTQRPSVNIITGMIKANFSSRLAFRLSSAADSRTILDTGGGEQLNGCGDMLFSNGTEVINLQSAFVDTTEVEKLSDYIGYQKGYPTALLLPEYIGEGDHLGMKQFDPEHRDPMFEEAARLIVMHQQGSVSLIQRKLKLGYNRAGHIIDQLEASGIVGPFEGSKAREVLFRDEYSLEHYLEQLESDKIAFSPAASSSGSLDRSPVFPEAPVTGTGGKLHVSAAPISEEKNARWLKFLRFWE
jgi:S-DNA-T family DNA segregation ATPase FtsK/SpoIIIE